MCATSDAIMLVHSIQDNDVLFGGQLTRKTLDANLLRISLEDFYKVIVGASERSNLMRVPFNCS